MKLGSVEVIGRRLDNLEAKRSVDSELLTRIDERTKRMAEDMAILKGDFVKKEEFEPIKRIVYGMVGTVLLAVIGALVALVLQRPA